MIALLVLIAAQVTGPLPFDQAVRQAEATGKPLLVIVQSDDCPPCKVMWRESIEPLLAGGELDGVIVTTLAPGPESEAMRVKVTPTLVGFRKRGSEWTRYRMEGRQPVDRVRQLIGRLR